MKTLYVAANAIEAHMLVHLLRQVDLTAHIQGEHLQGAVGELPAAGMVRLMIPEEQYPRARDVIDQWEADQPPEPLVPRHVAPSRSVGASHLAWFIAGVVVGACLMALGSS
jgi:hypothetical protein